MKQVNKEKRDRVCQCLAVIAALWFCFSIILLHYVRDDLSLWHTTLSIYAVGPAGWVLTLGFYSAGISQALIAYRYYQLRSSTGDLLTIGVLVLAAVGAILVALFPYPIKLPHNTGAVMQLGLFPLSLLLRVVLRRDDSLWTFSATIALLCSLGFLLMLGDGMKIFDLLSFGFIQKAEIICIALWLLFYSWLMPVPQAV
ncbi:MAG: DUF998 domain-containing protein [Pseudohongiella sp.]|nr:DUF998 domain-containing protein [Pseudohongiella sp.]